MSTPEFELYKTDHGIDGWDARTTLEARFTTKHKAVLYLATRGYCHIEYGSFYHLDPAKRHCMGCISFKIENTKLVPEDPQ